MLLVWVFGSFFILGWALLRFVFAIPYTISSSGMYPTQIKGRSVWACRLAYRTPGRVRRGDVIAYHVTVEGKARVYMKRVIGVPGDRVKTRDGAVFLNGSPLQQKAVRTEKDFLICAEDINGMTYEVALPRAQSNKLPEAEVLVPQKAFFVLGDNRFNSIDSRITGFVDWDAIIARVW
jgi:signal peptidase I